MWISSCCLGCDAVHEVNRLVIVLTKMLLLVWICFVILLTFFICGVNFLDIREAFFILLVIIAGLDLFLTVGFVLSDHLLKVFKYDLSREETANKGLHFNDGVNCGLGDFNNIWL